MAANITVIMQIFLMRIIIFQKTKNLGYKHKYILFNCRFQLLILEELICACSVQSILLTLSVCSGDMIARVLQVNYVPATHSICFFFIFFLFIPFSIFLNTFLPIYPSNAVISAHNSFLLQLYIYTHTCYLSKRNVHIYYLICAS